MVALTAAAIGTGAIVADKFVRNSGAGTPAPLMSLTSATKAASIIYADDGHTVIGVDQGPENSVPVDISQISPILQAAVLDTEDERFYQHGGMDIPSTIRALVSNASSSGGLQGGSTIAQQLVKQTLGNQRRISRKVKEAVIASRLEKHYPKSAIFNSYLNAIYLGEGAYGMQAASLAYFGKGANQLTIDQAALLAGMIQNPNGYNPVNDPNNARARRHQVLTRMLHYGTINQAELDQADAAPLPTHINKPPAPPPDPSGQIGYYLSDVNGFLLTSTQSPLPGPPVNTQLPTWTKSQRYQELYEGGLHIYTNLNIHQEALATTAVASLGGVERGGQTGALVAINPTNGAVTATASGLGYTKSQYDLTTAQHLPGSGFKLFSLLAAYAQGLNTNDQINGNQPCNVKYPVIGNTGPLHNDEQGSGGIETLTAATAQSVNCAFLRLGAVVGLQNIVHWANLLGVNPPGDFKGYGKPPQCTNYCADLVIGAEEGVSQVQMANAYATIDDGGVYHPYSYINHIDSVSGQNIYNGLQPGSQVVPPVIDQEVITDLESVTQSGTGAGFGDAGGHPIAGKTGTATNGADLWWNGFTPGLEATAWVGNPTHDQANYGFNQQGRDVIPAWMNFMTGAVAGMPPTQFSSPPAGAFGPSTLINAPEGPGSAAPAAAPTPAGGSTGGKQPPAKKHG